LYAVDAVYAINEQDQDEDERDLHPILEFRYQRTLASAELVRLYGEIGEAAYMKVNIFRRIVNGRGMMRSMNSVISATSSRKTCVPRC